MESLRANEQAFNTAGKESGSAADIRLGSSRRSQCGNGNNTRGIHNEVEVLLTGSGGKKREM